MVLPLGIAVRTNHHAACVESGQIATLGRTDDRRDHLLGGEHLADECFVAAAVVVHRHLVRVIRQHGKLGAATREQRVQRGTVAV